jgi:vacuolar-type H+-ATPase subunit C/Vma6
MGKAKGQEKVTRRKTSIVISDGLLQELKFAALEERTDVSALLGRLAEQYLKARRGGRR